MSEPAYRPPRVNLRPDEGPPPARRATDRYITWGAVNVALAMWGFVALMVTVNLLLPVSHTCSVILWVFSALFVLKAAFMTWVSSGLVGIWLHYRGRRRR